VFTVSFIIKLIPQGKSMLNKLSYSSSSLHATNLDEKHGSYDYQKKSGINKEHLGNQREIFVEESVAALTPRGKVSPFPYVV
jgi:hypothetical protein